MADFVPSLIRTWVPTVVGAFLAWLSSRWGITDVDATGAIMAVTGLFIGIYYALVRYAETKFPVVGVLLGRRSAPQYDGV